MRLKDDSFTFIVNPEYLERESLEVDLIVTHYSQNVLLHTQKRIDTAQYSTK